VGNTEKEYIQYSHTGKGQGAIALSPVFEELTRALGLNREGINQEAHFIVHS
jgi:hypothetical protein